MYRPVVEYIIKGIDLKIIKFFQKNRKLFKFALILIVIFGIFLLIIDRAFFYGITKRIPPNTVFSASDWMIFLGGLFNSGIAILGVYWTIRSNQDETKSIIKNADKQYKIDQRFSIIPFLALNKIIWKYDGNPVISSIARYLDSANSEIEKNTHEIEIKDDIRFIESKFENIYFVISETNSVTEELSEEIKEKLKNGWNSEDGKISPLTFDYLPMIITNCGCGAAINIVYTLTKVGDQDFAPLISEPTNLPKDKEIRMGIFFNNKENSIGTYKLEISYYDIHSEKYSQIHFIDLDSTKLIINTKIDQKIIFDTYNE